MYQHNDQFYDSLSIATAILQLITIAIPSEDSTNNDLMEELQKQDREYLQTIIEQNEKILDKLNQITRY